MADEIGPWTVKGVPPENREEILRAAKRGNTTVGEFICSAALLKIHHERNGPPMSSPGKTVALSAGSPAPAGYFPEPTRTALDIYAAVAAGIPGLATDPKAGAVLSLARKVMRQQLTSLLIPAAPKLSDQPQLPAPDESSEG